MWRRAGPVDFLEPLGSLGELQPHLVAGELARLARLCKCDFAPLTSSDLTPGTVVSIAWAISS